MSDDFEICCDDDGCPRCGSVTYRRDCEQCGGEGGFDGEDLMEEDPLWYDEDSYESCSNCRGRGYFEWCSSESCDWHIGLGRNA